MAFELWPELVPGWVFGAVAFSASEYDGFGDGDGVGVGVSVVEEEGFCYLAVEVETSEYASVSVGDGDGGAAAEGVAVGGELFVVDGARVVGEQSVDDAGFVELVEDE